MTHQHQTQEEQEKRQFILSNAIKGILWLAAIIGAYLLAALLLPEQWEEVLDPITENTLLMFSVFFLSETFIGIIPPELFVIWASSQPLSIYLIYLLVMAVLSWTGGLIAYLVGKQFHNLTWVQRMTKLENFQRYTRLYRKFGGVVIVVSALTPLPYAMISFLSATFKFPLPKYLIYSAMRFLRFVLLGWLFWNINVS